MKGRIVLASMAAAWFAVGAVVSFVLIGVLMRLHVHEPPNLNLWFEVDAVRVFSNLTDRGSDHYRTSVHPLASLLLSTPTIALIKLGASPETAARIVAAMGAGLMLAAFFVLLYRVLGRLLDAAVFTALLGASAAFLFFNSVFDLYVWGGASIVLALIAATVTGKHTGAALVIANAASLSITVTNWMTGIAAATVRAKPARAALYVTLGFAAVAALSVVQTHLYPTAGRFLSVQEEGRYIELNLAQRALEVPRIFFLDSVVLSRISDAVDNVGNPYTTAQSGPISLGFVGGLATVLWLGLLSLGAYGAWAARRGAEIPRAIAMITALLIGAQFVLHLLYGGETFLYALHYAPLLILLASFAALTRWRTFVLAGAGVLVVAACVHNAQQFERAYAQANRLTYAAERPPHTPRDQVLEAMAQRPDDFWPRGVGHVPLGVPGGPELDKGWMEPGGSFSPAEKSFGISIWVRDANGLQTSDTIPLPEARQSFIGAGARDGVGARVETPAYVVEWRQRRLGHWEMSLTPRADDVEITLRSVGPAGGRIDSLRAHGGDLYLNERWRLSFENARLVDMGEEGEEGWMQRRAALNEAQFPDGWGSARFEVNGPARLVIADLQHRPFFSPLSELPVGSGVRIEGGDPRFAAALDAQVRQMLTGAVGIEARPGDPLHYPLAWQRDGAYVVVALARAGRLDAARLMVRDVAQRDFFGGFGAEADAPGLALWAIGTLSRALDDPEFDAEMWPHVHRKAELIVDMAQGPVRAGFDGPAIPDFANNPDLDLVTEAPVDGLINGRMDWHRPNLFLSAVSDRGLAEALRFARRMRSEADARTWGEIRGQLGAAYLRAMERGEGLDNERTFIMAPESVWSARLRPIFAEALARHWTRTRAADGGFIQTPPWTYFEIAMARQWLRMGRPERTWATLEYFWRASPAPDLYTLWESDFEQHGFARWSATRGWVKPPHVTPHYWASAEMVLTLTAMLADVEGDTLVVGAGVPATWAESPMRVSGLMTDLGPVSWAWDGGTLTVTACHTVWVRGAGVFASAPVVVRRSC